MWGAKACDLSHSYTLAGNAWNTDFLGLSGACKVFCKTLVQCLVCVEKVIAARCSWCFAYKRMWEHCSWLGLKHTRQTHAALECLGQSHEFEAHVSYAMVAESIFEKVVHQGLTELRVPRRTCSVWVDTDLGPGSLDLSTQHMSWLSTQHMCVPEQNIHPASQQIV